MTDPVNPVGTSSTNDSTPPPLGPLPPDFRKQLLDLAQEIAPIDQTVSGRLQEIEQAIASNQTSFLAAIGTEHIIDAHVLQFEAEGFYRARPFWTKVLGVIEWLRNGAVFAPIVITWLHLKAAAENYQSLLDKGQVPSDSPFLLLWQEGFKIPGAAKFSDVAFQVAVAVGGLIFLTLLVHWSKDATSGWSESKALALRKRVEEVLWRLSQYLAEERRQQQSVMIESLAKMVQHADHLLNEVYAERKGLVDIARQRETEFARLNTLNEGLDKSSRRLVKYGSLVEQSFRELKDAISGLTVGIEKGSQQQTTVLNTVEATSGKTLLAMESIQHTNGNIEMALRQMTDESLRNSRMLQNLSVSLDEVGALAATLREGEASLRQAMNSMRTVSQTLIDNYAEKVGEAYAPVRATVEQISIALGQFERVQIQMGSTLGLLSAAGDNYKDLTTSVDQHLQDVAMSITQSTQGLDGSLKQVLTAVGSLETAASAWTSDDSDIRQNLKALSEANQAMSRQLEMMVNALPELVDVTKQMGQASREEADAVTKALRFDRALAEGIGTNLKNLAEQQAATNRALNTIDGRLNHAVTTWPEAWSRSVFRNEGDGDGQLPPA